MKTKHTVCYFVLTFITIPVQISSTADGHPKHRVIRSVESDRSCLFPVAGWVQKHIHRTSNLCLSVEEIWSSHYKICPTVDEIILLYIEHISFIQGHVKVLTHRCSDQQWPQNNRRRRPVPRPTEYGLASAGRRCPSAAEPRLLCDWLEELRPQVSTQTYL